MPIMSCATEYSFGVFLVGPEKSEMWVFASMVVESSLRNSPSCFSLHLTVSLSLMVNLFMESTICGSGLMGILVGIEVGRMGRICGPTDCLVPVCLVIGHLMSDVDLLR